MKVGYIKAMLSSMKNDTEIILKTDLNGQLIITVKPENIESEKKEEAGE